VSAFDLMVQSYRHLKSVTIAIFVYIFKLLVSERNCKYPQKSTNTQKWWYPCGVL